MEKLGFFSEHLAHSMARKGMTGNALATRLGCCYEHVRKMTKGDVLPSPVLLQRLCGVFRWSQTRMRRFVMIDRARKAFGDNFWIVLGKNPRLEPVYILWEFLTEEEKDYFMDCLRQLVARKQAAQARGGEPSQP